MFFVHSHFLRNYIRGENRDVFFALWTLQKVLSRSADWILVNHQWAPHRREQLEETLQEEEDNDKTDWKAFILFYFLIEKRVWCIRGAVWLKPERLKRSKCQLNGEVCRTVQRNAHKCWEQGENGSISVNVKLAQLKCQGEADETLCRMFFHSQLTFRDGAASFEGFALKQQ